MRAPSLEAAAAEATTGDALALVGGAEVGAEAEVGVAETTKLAADSLSSM